MKQALLLDVSTLHGSLLSSVPFVLGNLSLVTICLVSQPHGLGAWGLVVGGSFSSLTFLLLLVILFLFDSQLGY